MKQLITGKIMGLVLGLFFAMPPLVAEIVTRTATIGDIRLTAIYDNIACLNSTTTITYTLENTGDTPFADIIEVNDFVPDGTQPGAAGLTSPVVVPPQPSGVVSFDTISGPNCGGASNGLGTWRASDAANPFPNNIPYSFTVTVTASQCGIWTFSPCLRALEVLGFCCLLTESLGNITILVIPYAIFAGGGVAFTCQDSTGIVGNLFPPSCFSPTSCTGTATGCDNNPFHYVITDVTGGTATLLDPTGGVFQFVPDPGFSGNGAIFYNVVSDTTPPAFCSPTGGNGYGVTVVQKPFVSGITISGCAGQGITGDANPSVTGGVSPYSFSIVGAPTCGDASITAGGIYTYTAPTGAGGVVCSFQIQASDSFLGCTGVGTVTVNVNATPVPDNQTLQTCVNSQLSGTLTATGGTAPYVFSITTPPTNGIISAFDPNTGVFIYTPNLNYTGPDSFTFDATDAAGCSTSFSGVITINVNPPPITSSTAINGCQNTSLTGSLLPLVTGGTGGAPVFSTTGPAPSCGGVLIFGNGDFTFSPNFGFTGCCDFQYAVSQGGCPGSGPSTVTVCIAPAPIATGAQFDICQFSNLTGNLNDFLLSSTGTTSFTAVGAPTNGSLFLNPAGPFSFTASISSGSAGFNYRAISDILPCPSDIERIDITVHPNPTVATGMINACSGFTKTGNLNPLVSGDGAPFTFTGPFSQVNGSATVNPNGTFTFTPNPGVTGGSFTFGVTTSFGCTGSGTEIIIVNDSPATTGVTGSVCSNSTLNGTLTGAVSGGTPPYVFSRVGLPSGGSAIVNTNGLFSFTPTPGATAGNFVYQATDQKGCFGTGPVDIFINLGPSASTGTFTGCEGGVSGDLSTLVTGANPPFTFSGPIGPVFNGTVVVNPDGTFSFVPFGVPGQGSFNYIVTDSSVPPCTSNPRQVTIDLEEGPQALPAFYDTCQDVPLVVSSASGLANYVTGGLPPYTFFQTGLAPLCGAVVVNPDGSFTYNPTPGFTGDCSFNWQVTDSIPCTSNISTGTVTVHPTPLASNSGPFGACQLVPFLGDLNDFMSLGTPPYSFTGGNPINGTINYLFQTGPFSFTPIAVGLASFDYSAIDSFGCQSNTGTLLFSVAESPVVTSPSPLDVCEFSTVSSTATATGSPAILPVTFSITDTENGTAVINPVTGDFTFTPDVDDFPTPTVQGSVTIRATAAPPSVCYGEVTVIINIHQNPIITITGLGSCTGTFTGNLAQFVTGGVPPYIFGPAGLVPTSPSGCGTVTLDVFGNFTFSANPPSAFPCPCSFDFTVTDSSSSTCTSTGSVAVCVNQPPFANNAFFCACANTPVTGFLGAFVTGGKPPFTFALVGVPVGGTVILNPKTGLFTFVPTPGFNGFASFQYQVTDSNNPPCVSNIGTVTIQVPCCPVFAGQ